jgi:hypothetical protein
MEKHAMSNIGHNGELGVRFNYRPLNADQTSRYKRILEEAKILATIIIRDCPPDSHESNVALGKLEEVVLWVHAAIVRRER